LDSFAQVEPPSTGFADWREREDAWKAAELAEGREPNVHARDYACMAKSAAMIACPGPSYGLGDEVKHMLDVELKPVLLLFPPEMKHSFVRHKEHPLLYTHVVEGESYKRAIGDFLWESPVPGPLIVICGGDGGGKKTLTAKLGEALAGSGCIVRTIDFPRRQFRFGPRLDIADQIYGELARTKRMLSPWLMAAKYAEDRACTKPILRHWQTKGYVILLDRYREANVAHQGALLPPQDLPHFISQLRTLELGVNGIPPGDLFVYLDTPVEQAHTAMVREGRALDNQERDMAHKQRVRDIYSQLAASEPDWVRIEAMDGSRRKTVEELVAEILPILEPLVAPVRRKALA